MLVLDTTVLIDALRGRAAAVRLAALADQGEGLATTSINVEEIARGLRPGEEEPTRALIAGLHVIAIIEEDGWRSGAWRRTFASQGATLAQADCLIAAAALRVGGRLATGNPDDFPQAELAVENWPVG